MPGLTVRENVQLGMLGQRGKHDLARAVDETAETTDHHAPGTGDRDDAAGARRVQAP